MEHVYVHIPFCRQKCRYCDFVSQPLSAGEPAAYLDLLEREIALYGDAKTTGVRTLYVGGGTPSLLSVAEHARLLAGLAQTFGLRQEAEITLEANPESVSLPYLRELRALGYNRLSLGVQSFADDQLAAMGRLHTADMARQAVMNAAQAGFTRISMDLIYGLPGQTLADWRQDLATAVALPVTHLSTYGLRLSEATPWGQRCAQGTLILPDDEVNSAMQLTALEFLAAHGYDWYEVANFALDDSQRCRHNLAYWQRRDYLGLGPGAASLHGDLRTRNDDDLARYAAALRAGRPPVADREPLDRTAVRTEEIMLALRLRQGLDLAAFAAKYSEDLWTEKKGQMVKFFNLGLIDLKNGCLRLTDRGLPLQNEVILALLR